MTQKLYVQVGASRDGLDSYRAAAQRRGMRTVLVEAPEYLAYRATLAGRPRFDEELAVAESANPDALVAALAAAGIEPAIVLAGFERYVAAARELARRLGIPPSKGSASTPPADKAGQRDALARRAPDLAQPRHVAVSLDDLAIAFDDVPFPAVLKPVNGGGGLGVYKVEDAAEARRAARRLRKLRNYDGADFPGFLLEELVQGVEFSLQGIMRNGQPDLLAFCEKIIAQEPDRQESSLCGFRELAHLARPGEEMPPEFGVLARRVMAALGYDNGPFHIDLIRPPGRDPVFIEAGYRLSGGGLVTLIERLTGVNWGEAAFAWEFERASGETPREASTDPRRPGCVAHALLSSRTEFELARAIRSAGPASSGAEVEVVEFAVSSASADKASSPLLASDRLRHGGFRGQVRVAGPDRATVARLLERILDAKEKSCAG